MTQYAKADRAKVLEIAKELEAMAAQTRRERRGAGGGGRPEVPATRDGAAEHRTPAGRAATEAGRAGIEGREVAAASSGTPHDELAGRWDGQRSRDVAIIEALGVVAPLLADKDSDADQIIATLTWQLLERGFVIRPAPVSVPGDPQERVLTEEQSRGVVERVLDRVQRALASLPARETTVTLPLWDASLLVTALNHLLRSASPTQKGE